MDFGIASVAAITVIAYLVGIGCKAAGSVKDELIPVICGCAVPDAGVPGKGCHQRSSCWYRIWSSGNWREPDL